MEAYDGGLLRLEGVPVPVVVDLTGLQAHGQVKALLHHDPSRPIGHMERVVIGATVAAEGSLSVAGPDRDHVIEAQRGGFEWEASIGLTVDRSEKVPPGRLVTVNGRQFRGPLVVVRSAKLREITFTGSGAGENTSATIAAMAAPLADSIMADELETATDTQNADGAATPCTDPTLDELKALRAEVKSDLDLLRQERAALQAERDAVSRERTAAHVDSVAAQLGLTGHEILADLRAKAASGEIKETDVELQLLRASRKGVGGLGVWGQGRSGAPAMPHVIEAAICLTSGWTEGDLERHFDAKTIEAAASTRWQGFGPRALMVEYLQAHGRHCIGGRLTSEDIQAGVMLAEQELHGVRASGGFSTISLPGILSNVAKKELLRGYDALESPILKIARRSTATDYKPYYAYRLTTQGLLERVGPDGELRSMELLEDEYQSRVFPWGRKLSLTDVMIRNDDLGAFSSLARDFGVLTKRTISKAGFTALLSQQSTFWTTDKKNRLAAGPGSALSLDSLGDAYQLFLQAEDKSGEAIDLEPKYLLVAPRDKVLAVNIHTQQQLNLSGPGVFAGNHFQGMFEPLHASHLANGKVPNANGTQWLLCADPAITSPIVAAFLDGRDGPQIRTWEAIPGRLGVQWDMSAHFGFNLHDDKAAVYSPGQ